MSVICINPYQFGVAGPAYDADAQAYITAVEAADAQPLEVGVKEAINDFVVGCKADNIWSAIKACCILAGARTLSGALVPLVGTAPTNVNNNFVQADYDRKTGLTGGPSKYLDTNRGVNADPQNSASLGVYYTAIVAQSGNLRELGRLGQYKYLWGNALGSLFGAINNSSFQSISPPLSGLNTGLKGGSRSNATNYQARVNGTTYTINATSVTPGTGSILLGDPGAESSPHTRGFYWTGESLDLALLEARVNTLINAIGAAIP